MNIMSAVAMTTRPFLIARLAGLHGDHIVCSLPHSSTTSQQAKKFIRNPGNETQTLLCFVLLLIYAFAVYELYLFVWRKKMQENWVNWVKKVKKFFCNNSKIAPSNLNLNSGFKKLFSNMNLNL
jgi:ABC-type phosphate/phosphonate transport system permease subunit